MPNWVTFDQETSSTLRSRMPQGSIFQRPGSSMMEYLLEDREATVAVLPSSGDNHAVVAVFRWNKLPAPAEPPMTPIRSRAGGFLGLTDEPLFEDEEPEEKKSWWQRLWE